MKHISRIAALILAVLVFCTGCGNVSTDKYSTTAAATYGDQTTYLDEANFWLRLNQWGTESYTGMLYRYYYGITDIWPVASGNRTQTFEQTLKENVMAEILQTYVLLDHTGDNATVLTDSDNAKLTSLVKDVRDTYADEFFALAGIANGEAGDAQLKTYLEKRVLAYKVALDAMKKIDVSVTDEECKSFTIGYLLVPEPSKDSTKSTESTEGSSSSSELSGEALANLIQVNLLGGDSWDETVSKWKSLTSSTVSYAYSDTTATATYYTEGKEMKTGESKVVYTSGTGWYVLYCINDDDLEAAAEKRDSLTSSRQAEAFNETYKTWQSAAKPFKVTKDFKNLKVEPSYVAKTTEAAPSTEAPSTEAATSTAAPSTEAATSTEAANN